MRPSSEEFRKYIGHQLHIARATALLTRKTLIDGTDLSSDGSLARYERGDGDIPLRVFVQLINKLQKPANEILGKYDYNSTKD